MRTRSSPRNSSSSPGCRGDDSTVGAVGLLIWIGGIHVKTKMESKKTLAAALGLSVRQIERMYAAGMPKGADSLLLLLLLLLFLKINITPNIATVAVIVAVDDAAQVLLKMQNFGGRSEPSDPAHAHSIGM